MVLPGSQSAIALDSDSLVRIQDWEGKGTSAQRKAADGKVAASDLGLIIVFTRCGTCI